MKITLRLVLVNAVVAAGLSINGVPDHHCLFATEPASRGSTGQATPIGPELIGKWRVVEMTYKGQSQKIPTDPTPCYEFTADEIWVPTLDGDVNKFGCKYRSDGVLLMTWQGTETELSCERKSGKMTLIWNESAAQLPKDLDASKNANLTRVVVERIVK